MIKQFQLKSFLGIAVLAIAVIFSACQPNTPERGHSPWVFRSVLDAKPRMLTVALTKDIWAAYHTDSCTLYKVWKGSVNLDGAVYTTAHGPQPATLGDAFTINDFTARAWGLVSNGKTEDLTVQYRGHRFVKNQVELMYDLKDAKGRTIQVFERPEWVEKDGLNGFERQFTTQNVPSDAQLVLKTNISSVYNEKSIHTEGGTLKIEKAEKRNAKDLIGQDIAGVLTLASNGKTTCTSYFTQKPLLENNNKITNNPDEEAIAEGLDLINHSDCRSCHNEEVKTVGPSYKQIAARYANLPKNVAMLTQKVRNGGAGVWGVAAMTPHPNVPEMDLQKMVQWIMDLDIKTEGSDGKPMAAGGDIAKALKPIAGLDEKNMISGLKTKIYQLNRSIAKVAEIYPLPQEKYAGILPSIHIESQDFKGLEANFAIIAEGYLKVAKTGTYVLRVFSDDGSLLRIGDNIVVNNDGTHGFDPKDAEVVMEEGIHRFKLEFFQATGGKGLQVQWRASDGGEFEDITQFLHENDRESYDIPTAATAAVVQTQPLPMASIKRIPGDGVPLSGVHPSFTLSQARPNDFAPKVAGMDFMPNGDLIVSTWDDIGGVYLVKNAQTGDPDKMRVRQIGFGLAEPLGLKVVNGRIFVLQKQELTELIDNDGDEMIDEYRTLNNSWRVSANFHEFAFGLAEKEGWLYGALATAIMPGGASARPQILDRGKIFRVNITSGVLEFVARGLRTPNGVGIGVDGEIFVADNQGDWLPSCKIMHVTKDAFFGSYSVDSLAVANMPVKQPVVWLPQDEIGNSPSTPLSINVGPYKGQMIHGEVTNGGLKRVFVEKINNEYQGCVFHFSQGFEAGINRIVWGKDSALYIGGIGNPGNWSHSGKNWFGLQRFAFNGNSTFEPLAIRAKSNGVEIEFTEPLAENDGWNASDYEVKQWWYKPTIEYGGPKMDEIKLPIKSANVSDDRKKVFLELEGMKEGQVVYVHIKTPFVSALGHELWITEGFYTMNSIPKGNFGERKAPPSVFAGLNSLSESEKKAGWQLLFDGKTLNGWRNFKKQTIGKDWIVDAENQAIHLNATRNPNGHWQTTDGGDIITNGTFENYELSLEWKIANCGNSGIIYNVLENDKVQYVWQTGPEMQVLDNACHPDARIEKHRAGDLYDMVKCRFETVNAAGEWNKARLVVRKGKVEHWLNGRKLVSFEMFSPAWKRMIAASKFKDMPYFGTGKRGHIALQDHGDKVWYRNIKIRNLD